MSGISLERRAPKLRDILEAARQRFRAGKGIPHETFWKEVEAVTTSKTAKPGNTQKREVKCQKK
jgi:hypothetical protein